MLSWRKGIRGYTRRTSRSSCWFYCPFYRFLVFFFRRRLRMFSFFSYPKRARRRRRGRKGRCRTLITYFYRRFFFGPIRPWHFVSYRGVSQFIPSLYPFSLLILLEDFWGDQAKRQQKIQPLYLVVLVQFWCSYPCLAYKLGPPLRRIFCQGKGGKTTNKSTSSSLGSKN